MVPAKAELCLTDSARFCLADIVVLDHVELLVGLLLPLVTDTYEHENVLSALPHGVEGDLDFGHVVRNSDLLGKFVVREFAFGVIRYLISLELPLIIMSRLEPRDHRVLVGFLYLVLIRPFIVFGLVNTKRFALKVQRVLVIAQLESVVVIAALLLDAQVAGFREGYD